MAETPDVLEESANVRARIAAARREVDRRLVLEAVNRHVSMVVDTVEGGGPHAGHELRQEGRCVYCVTCGTRLGQFRLPARLRGPRRWQVRLADGFVAYRGPERDAHVVAARHEGAVVEPSDD